MKRRHWFTNRVIWGLAIFLFVVAVYEFHYKPQYRPYYEEGVKRYQAGDFMGALEQFQRAHAIAPNSSDVLLMLGWSNLKLHHFEEARWNFENTLRIDPRVIEARIGMSFVVLETGRGTIDVEAMARVLEERPKDANIQIVAAGALVEKGENLKAAQMYSALLGSANYRRAADTALRGLYGLDENEQIPAGLPGMSKPAQTEVPYRAGENAIWRKTETGWQQFYVAGVILLPDTPGYTPGMIPNDPGFYAHWVQQVTELGANTIHVTSLLPPSFYRAYQRSGGGIALLQQVSFNLPRDGDLYEKPYEAGKAEIRHTIDALHGQGNVPARGRGSSGLYTVDVSANVAGILLGGDLDPAAVLTTNLRNPQKNRYAGRYVSINAGTPTEVWIAQMLDYAAQYETDTYGWQHPLAFANQPAFDPLDHPTESTATRNDAVSIDEAKFKTNSNFAAGLFASYSVRPYYPDFLLREPRLQAGTDGQGPNPLAVYVRDLRARVPLPLVISGFGIPSAIGVQRIQKGGWNQGGISEADQAAFVTRMARTIREAGCAGASVYQLTDEWYRANGIAAELSIPRDRAALWLNEMSPDSRFGLIGFRSSLWQLFAGDGSAWKKERILYQNSAPAGPEPGKNLRTVQAAADEAFFYLRLSLSCLQCRSSGRGAGDFPAFALALNTLPGRTGVKKLPFGNVSLPAGANFLLYVGPDAGTLWIESDYNPYQIVAAPGSTNNNEFRRKKPFRTSLQAEGRFEEMVWEIAEPVYGRDGVYYPPQRHSASTLRRARENVGSADVDSIAEWYPDAAHNAVVVRIPWGKLLVTDPSSMRVFAGLGQSKEMLGDTTQGIQVSVFSLPSGVTQDFRTWIVSGSFPGAPGGTVGSPEMFTWKPWNTVNPEMYKKAAFAAVQKEFGAAQPASGPLSRGGFGKKAGGRR